MLVDAGSAFGDLERASFDRINAHPIPIVRTSKVVRRCMHVHTYICTYKRKKVSFYHLPALDLMYVTLHYIPRFFILNQSNFSSVAEGSMRSNTLT